MGKLGRKRKHKYKSYHKAKREGNLSDTAVANTDIVTNNYKFSVGDNQDFSFKLAEKNPHPPGGKTASINNIDISFDIEMKC